MKLMNVDLTRRKQDHPLQELPMHAIGSESLGNAPSLDDAPAYRASVCPKDAIPDVLATHLNDLVNVLQTANNPPALWLIIQDSNHVGPYADIDDDVADAFLHACVEGHIKKNEPIALLIDSDGGIARGAYRIASILRQHCGGFIALVPRRAKSAATLLVLGADQVFLGCHAELGPIDAQYLDPEDGQYASALADVEAMSRVQGFATDAITLSWDVLYRHLHAHQISNAALIEPTVNFATRTIEPLLRQFDVTTYSQRVRDLSVGERYAEGLLRRRYSLPVAQAIANALVRSYPEHEFIIDQAEINRLMERVSVVVNPQSPLPSITEPPPPEIQEIFNKMFLHLRNVFAIGRMMPAGQSSEHDDYVQRVQQESRVGRNTLRL